MSEKDAGKNKGTVEKKTKRNKKTDADGVPYDKRKGDYTAIDHALEEEEDILHDWLTPERCEIELGLLNRSKEGRRYLYPPSLILYILYLKEDEDRSYRRSVDGLNTLLKLKGLRKPNYSTLHRSEMKYFGTDLGERIITKSTVILRELGFDIVFDPIQLIHTGVCPTYKAPQKIATCQKDVDEQKEKDLQAEKMSKSMEVVLLKAPVEDGCSRTCAVDGSGEGVSGPGIYMEHMWKLNDRGFIKQHTMIDVRTQEPVAVSITLEKPGDSAMFPHLVEATTEGGIVLDKVLADSAYDSTANWKVARKTGVEFVPNLKKTFGTNEELPERNMQLEKEKELGKKEFHITTGYNIRWLVEAFFSAFKKMYGDTLRSKLFERMVMTMHRRYVLFSLHKRLYARARRYIA